MLLARINRLRIGASAHCVARRLLSASSSRQSSANTNKNASIQADLLVIGAGSGGVACARRAAMYGARVVLAESGPTGGTCVNVGCIPKKLFVYGAEFVDEFRRAVRYGHVGADVGSVFEWSVLRDNTMAEVQRLNGIYENMLKNSDVQLIRGHAQLLDTHHALIAPDVQAVLAQVDHHEKPDLEYKSVEAKHVVIATGGRPWVPDDHAVHGLSAAGDAVMTSDDCFTLEELPRSMIIVGAGYIALEFASVFNALGVDVTVSYRGAHILRSFDRDIRNLLLEKMKERCVKFIMHSDVIALRKTNQEDGGVDVVMDVRSLDDSEVDCGIPMSHGSTRRVTQHAEKILFATGRRANTSGLGLGRVGIETNERGEILVDDECNTSIDRVYALGDVTGRSHLTPVAIADGRALAERLFNDVPTTAHSYRRKNHSLIPTAVFSQPSVATVGMTEAEAEAAVGDIHVYKVQFRPLKYTVAQEQSQMLMKLVVCQETDKVLGAHVLGDHAAEYVQLLAVCINAGVTKEQFDTTMALHPSSSEEFVLM